MKTETIKVARAEWDGFTYRASRRVGIEAERVGAHFAIHKSIEPLSGYKYTVTHVKTGWALCRTRTKPDARKAVKMAEKFPGIDWAKLTHKSQQTPAIRALGRDLLMALASSGLASDIRIVDNEPMRAV